MDEIEARVIARAAITFVALILGSVDGNDKLRRVDRRFAIEAERATIDDRRVVRFAGEGRVVDKNAIDPLLISFPPLTFSH